MPPDTPDYKGFSRWCINKFAWSYDVDGSHIQEKAEEFGIIRQVAYDPDKHGENDMDAEPGDPWYEYVELR